MTEKELKPWKLFEDFKKELSQAKKEVEKLNDELGTQDAGIIVLRGQLAEWKMWAERLSITLDRYHNNNEPHWLLRQNQHNCEGCSVLSDYQKFKESQGSKEKQG